MTVSDFLWCCDTTNWVTVCQILVTKSCLQQQVEDEKYYCMC